MNHEKAVAALESLSMVDRDIKRRYRTAWLPTIYRVNENWFVKLARTVGRTRVFYASATTFPETVRKLLVEIASNQRSPDTIRTEATRLLSE